MKTAKVKNACPRSHGRQRDQCGSPCVFQVTRRTWVTAAPRPSQMCRRDVREHTNGTLSPTAQKVQRSACLSWMGKRPSRLDSHGPAGHLLQPLTSHAGASLPQDGREGPPGANSQGPRGSLSVTDTGTRSPHSTHLTPQSPDAPRGSHPPQT